MVKLSPWSKIAGTYLFSAVRNEAPFLLEWIAYHKIIGFENVVIMANPSSDGTDELLQALADAGEIIFFPHTPAPGVAAQRNAAMIANENALPPNGAWACWLDADEFLVVRVGSRRVIDLIAAVGDRSGALINWRLFGDGGNLTFPGRFVSSAFSRASARRIPPNREAKSFFRKSAKIRGFSTKGINRPHIAIPISCTEFLAPSGKPVAESAVNENWLKGLDLADTARVDKTEEGHTLAQINHYSVRTPEHFLLKRRRGRGWLVRADGANLRHTNEFYHKFNRNGQEDREILVFEDAVTLEIARLMGHETVAQAAAAADLLVRSQIAALPMDELLSLHFPPASLSGIKPD